MRCLIRSDFELILLNQHADSSFHEFYLLFIFPLIESELSFNKHGHSQVHTVKKTVDAIKVKSDGGHGTPGTNNK